MSFRSTLFWVHLVAGLISGLSIAIMCFTGTVLAFEKELIAWSERDARQIAPPPASTPRLTLEQMQSKLRETHPDARPSGIVLQNDPRAAVAFTVGRSGGYYVNPYTGEARQPGSTALSGFMHTMVDLHRTLGFHGEQSRPVGKWINGVCNLAFCVLALTGLYLWMPRSWSWRTLRPVIWFRQNATARARDFNWHNAIGFWTAPVLIVLTLTAVPISFRWGGNLIYTLTGTPAPASTAGGPGGGRPGGGTAPAPAVDVPTPPAGARPLSQDALVATVQATLPSWRTLTLRLANAAPGGAGGRGGSGGRGGRAARGGERGAPGGDAPAQPGGERARATVGPDTRGVVAEDRSPEASRPQAVTFSVRTTGSWPRTATTTLALDPYTGAILQRTGYGDLNAAQQMRSWTRFLHTGEALGVAGQLVAGLACLGGVFLVYTGFALSWRRFFGQRRVATREPTGTPEAVQTKVTSS